MVCPLPLIHQSLTSPGIRYISIFISPLDDLAVGTPRDKAPGLHGRCRQSLFKNALYASTMRSKDERLGLVAVTDKVRRKTEPYL